MGKRSRAGVATKRRPRKKPAPPKRSAARKLKARSPSPAAADATELARLSRELSEARDQQLAMSEVLHAISASPGDLERIFQAMLERAVRICGAKFGSIYRWDGDALHLAATHNTPPAFAAERRRSPYRPYSQSPIGRMMVDKTVAHISDITAEEAYLTQLDPVAVSAAELGRIRTILGVPLLNKDEMIGAFSCRARKFDLSPKSRSSWSRTSPRRPSSPSRTRGCSTSCASAPPTSARHWSIRQLRQKSCASFRLRKAIWNAYSTAFWRMRRDYVGRSSAISICGRRTGFGM